MSGLTGIGCTLVPHPPSGALRVSALDPEGPAFKSGYIGIGDVLFEVDENRQLKATVRIIYHLCVA